MEHIWSPWRYQYVAASSADTGCVFCRILDEGNDRENRVLHRGSHNFVILNRFPYTSGHLMIVPYAHEPSLTGLDQDITIEMIDLAKLSQRALELEYSPDGFNIGFNIGKSAGAGVAEHIHLHVVPRWAGDANFVSVIGETRVLPEDLEGSFNKLVKHFGAATA
jgi:ATP adenylyltransferase